MWRIGQDTVETATLLISELVTNAVKGSGTNSPTGRIVVSLRYADGELTASVTDPALGPPIMREPDSEAESGRGLMLVQALSQEWGYHLLPAEGKVVYFVLAVRRNDEVSSTALAA